MQHIHLLLRLVHQLRNKLCQNLMVWITAWRARIPLDVHFSVHQFIYDVNQLGKHQGAVTLCPAVVHAVGTIRPQHYTTHCLVCQQL